MPRQSANFSTLPVIDDPQIERGLRGCRSHSELEPRLALSPALPRVSPHNRLMRVRLDPEADRSRGSGFLDVWTVGQSVHCMFPAVQSARY